MKLTIHSYALPHRHTFRIARESKSIQKTCIVELSDGIHSGYGESAEDTYYGATVERMYSDLIQHQTHIEHFNPDEPEELWASLAPQLAHNHFALNALDIAAHDLAGKRAGKKLYELWSYDPTHNVPTDYTIGIDSIPKMIDKMAEFPDWPIYKIKLGTEEDVNIIRQLRQHSDSIFRVDANCGWQADECLKNAEAFSHLNVEFIEQPLAADNLSGHKAVYKQSAIPILADESCIVETDVEKCAEYFHGINIKLCKCGGLTPARRMITQAKQFGLKVMVGCMTESTVGISAIAHLLPQLDYVDMDGALLLAQDTASGVSIKQGVCHYANENGTGAQLLAPQPLTQLRT